MISKQDNITKHHDFWGWFFFEFCSCVSKSICCLIVFWLQFLAMSTPRPYVVLRRPHVHNTTMSHDAEVLRNPTHKIPPEFARVLSRSYQRYLSENMKMCVSYRVWGQFLFKVEDFICFVWFRICFRKKADANGLIKENAKVLLFRAETDSGKSSSSSFERGGRPKLGETADMKEICPSAICVSSSSGSTCPQLQKFSSK